VRARAADATLAEAFTRYQSAGLSEEDADRLTGEAALVAFVDAALRAHDDAAAIAKWAINELLRELKDRSPTDLPFDGAAFGRFVALAESDAVTATAAKDVFAEMIANGGEAEAIVDARGLRQVKDEDALGSIVDGVLAAHPGEVARYREGKTSLLGFFMGQVMKASKGKANPGLVKPLIAERLGEVDPS
jgi:glutaminyl-tRNA synthetase